MAEEKITLHLRFALFINWLKETKKNYLWLCICMSSMLFHVLKKKKNEEINKEWAGETLKQTETKEKKQNVNIYIYTLLKAT